MDWSYLNSGQVSDALEEAGLPQTVLQGFMRFDAGTRPTYGPAFPIQQQRKSHGVPRSRPEVSHGAAIRDEAPPGFVVIIDNGGRNDAATWGGNHTRRSLSKGLAGTIVFGATRDVDEIQRMDYPLFATGLSPIKSRWTTHTASVNQPINIAGIVIAPGDLIFADRTGIISIPTTSITEVWEIATKIWSEENKKGNS